MRRILLLLSLLVPTFAFAQNHVLEVTPFGGYQWGGNISARSTDIFNQDVNVSDSGSYGVLLDVPIDYGFQLELLANHQETSLNTDSGLFDPAARVADINIDYYHAGFLWQFDPAPNVRPFMTMSLGLANLSLDLPNVSNEQRLSGSIGGGVKVFLNRNIGLRFEGRGFWTNTTKNENHCCNGGYYDYYYNDDLYQGEALVGVIFAF